MTALAGPDDLIVSNQANHASIIDGCRLSALRSKFIPTPIRAPRAASARSVLRRRLLAAESLFSMDGDVAPLRDLSSAAARTGAALIVDEAHALGVLGSQGRGACHSQA